MRRVVHYTLSDEKLFEWFHKHALIPNGSSLHGVHYEPNARSFIFTVENGAFRPVQEGDLPERKRLEYGG